MVLPAEINVFIKRVEKCLSLNSYCAILNNTYIKKSYALYFEEGRRGECRRSNYPFTANRRLKRNAGASCETGTLDIDEKLETIKAELIAAGIEAVQAEAQAQLDAYLAAQ